MIRREALKDEESIIDPVTGWAVNIPLGFQQTREYWTDHPEEVARIMVMRGIAGINVDDFPTSAPTPVPEHSPEVLTAPPRPRATVVGKRPDVMMSGKGADLQGDIDFLRRLMETKSGKRFVRSAEGARRFGKPIGSLITREDRERARAKNSGGKKTPSAPDKPDAPDAAPKSPSDAEPKISNLEDKSLDDFGDLSDRSLSEEIEDKTRRGLASDSNRWGYVMNAAIGTVVLTHQTDQSKAAKQKNYITTYISTVNDPTMSGGYVIRADRKTGDLTATLIKKGERSFIYAKGNDEETLAKLVEASLRSLRNPPNKRLTTNSDEYDAEGKWHRNRRPRDYDALVELNEGIRGWDYQVDPSEADIDPKSYEQRMELARKEAAELGYTLGESLFYEYGGAAKMDMPVVEHINSIMRTFEDMYPGFGALIDSIAMADPKKSKGIAWNGTSPAIVDTGDTVQWNGMGFNAKYFANTAKARRELLELAGVNPEHMQKDAESKAAAAQDIKDAAKAGDVDGAINFHAVPAAVLMEAYGWDATKAVTTMVATHEIGHTVGNILQGSLARNGRLDGIPNPNGGDGSVADFHRRRMLEIFEDYGFVPRGTAESTPAGTSQRWMNIGREGFNPKTDPFDRDAISEHLSQYGATNVSEIMAETWAAYQLHPNPGDYVREMGELMEAALQDFLAEEEPDKRYVKKSVRIIRAESGAQMPSARPDFSNRNVGDSLNIPTDAGQTSKYAKRGDPPTNGYGRGRIGYVESVDPPKITFVTRTVYDEDTRTWEKIMSDPYVWDDVQGWVPESGGE